MLKFLIIALVSVTLFSNDIIIKKSCVSVDAAVQNLKEIVTKKGLSVFVVVDHTKNAKGVNMKLNDSKEVIFGNPLVGTALMQEDMTVGLDLPLRILIYKDVDEKVKIAYRNGTWLASKHPIKASKLIKKVNKGMAMFVSKAGQCKKD